MEETTSVFWVDLGFRLRSRKRVPLQGFRGVTDTPSCFLFLLCMLYMYLFLLYMFLTILR